MKNGATLLVALVVVSMVGLAGCGGGGGESITLEAAGRAASSAAFGLGQMMQEVVTYFTGDPQTPWTGPVGTLWSLTDFGLSLELRYSAGGTPQPNFGGADAMHVVGSFIGTVPGIGFVDFDGDVTFTSTGGPLSGASSVDVTGSGTVVYGGATGSFTLSNVTMNAATGWPTGGSVLMTYAGFSPVITFNYGADPTIALVTIGADQWTVDMTDGTVVKL